MQQQRGQHISMSSLAGSGHKNSMRCPLEWIDISALTDQSLILKLEGPLLSCLFSKNCWVHVPWGLDSSGSHNNKHHWVLFIRIRIIDYTLGCVNVKKCLLPKPFWFESFVLYTEKTSTIFHSCFVFSGSNLKQRKPDYSVFKKQRPLPYKTKYNFTAQHVFTTFVRQMTFIFQ